MILHPGILALIVGSCIVFVMMLYASVQGMSILAGWDFQSSSEKQLNLERRTYLISTIIKYALGFEILSTLLFIYTADDIHTLFVGAMCATGSLNANPIGRYALYSKILVFFSASLWITLNNLIWPNYYGRRYLGAIRGIVLPLSIITTSVGPPVYGYLLDALAPSQVWMISTGAFAFAAVLVLFAHPPKAPAPTTAIPRRSISRRSCVECGGCGSWCSAFQGRGIPRTSRCN